MKLFYGLLLISSYFIVGCVGLSKQLEFTDTQSHSLVVGYLETDKTPANMDLVEYKQVTPASDKPYYYFRVDKNVFYREDFFAPGRYKLYQFIGHPRSIFTQISEYDIAFPDNFNFNVGQPGKVYFLGSYKGTQVGGDLFSTGHVEYQRLEHPSELEVLQMILPDAIGSTWEPVIQNAIAALSGQPAAPAAAVAPASAGAPPALPPPPR
jgi:hypothetical protein